MSVHAIVDADGHVINMVEYDGEAEFDPGEGLKLVDTAGQDAPPNIGWTYAKGKFMAPPKAAEPEPVPASVSRRQFFQALAVKATVSNTEALAAVRTGEIPAAMQTFVDAMPAGDRFAAEMLLSGAATFDRANPLVPSFMVANGMKDADVDDLWRLASTL